MDTTNVNSGERSGLKRLLKHAVPFGVWIGCENHKLALCFKHLLLKFNDVFTADATLTALWKFFHYCPLAMSFIENAAEVFQEDSIVPVCPSVTRWTAHDRACKSICNGYKQYLSAISPHFVATILLLRDVFTVVQPLNLVLQKSIVVLCLADIPVYLNKSYSAFEKLKSCNVTRPYLPSQSFKK